MKPLAEQQGVDLQALLNEAAARKEEERQRLAGRLQESIVPLYLRDVRGQPCAIGTCVLVSMDSGFFAFTAAHVIRDAGSSRLWAPSEGTGGKLLPLPQCTAHLRSSRNNNDLDVGVIALPAGVLGAFAKRVFLTGAEIDQEDQSDDAGPAAFYFVLGYPASWARVKVPNSSRHIDQKSFHFATSCVASAEYIQEEVSQLDHVLLDFDHKEIVVGTTVVNPPRLQGVSGGGVFHISRNTNRGPLVAIATQHRKNSRLIVGTRIKHFLGMVRELRATSPPESFR